MTGAITMPTALLAGFAAKSVYDFQKVANTVEAVTNITKKQREELEKYARTLSPLYGFSGTEIMQSALELGRGGFNYEQMMGALRSTLALSRAGDIELKESSDIATNVLTAMRLPMKTTEQVAQSLTRVNDVLAYAANNSNINVRELGETFKYVGPMAAAAGMGVEQVAAAAMVMGNNGIRASEAGVALRSALVRMVKPTRDMMAVLARANINLKDFVKGGRQINAQSIVDSLATDGVDAKPFIGEIERALRDPKFARNLPGLTQRLVEIVGGGTAMDRSKLAENISDALTAAGSEVDLLGFVKALQDKGIDLGEIARIFDARQGARLITLLAGFKDLGTFLTGLETKTRGYTERTAGIMQQGIVGAWARFSASVQQLWDAIARSGVLEGATNALSGVAGALERIGKVNPDILKFGTYALLIGAAAGPLMVAGSNLLKLISLITAGAAIATGGGVATGVGAGTAAVAGAGAGAAAAARGGLLRTMLARALPWVGGYLVADQAWRAIGGHAAVEEFFRERPLARDTMTERLREINRRFDAMGGVQMPTPNSLTGPTIQSKPGEAAAAGAETGSALYNALDRELRTLRTIAATFLGVSA